MANMLFLYGKAKVTRSGAENCTFKALLERSTSTWTPNNRQATLAACTGLVEISAAGYSRATLSNPTVTVDAAIDRVNLDMENGSFGTPASGQSFISILYYIEVDGTAANDIPLYRQDTGLGVDLPAPLQNGAMTVTISDLIRILNS